MRPFRVVEPEILLKPCSRLLNSAVSFEEDVLILDSAPQSLGEDVVHTPASSVHTDLNILRSEQIRVARRGEVAALVRIVDLGNGDCQSVLEVLQAKINGNRRMVASCRSHQFDP